MAEKTQLEEALDAGVKLKQRVADLERVGGELARVLNSLIRRRDDGSIEIIPRWTFENVRAADVALSNAKQAGLV